MVVPERGGRQAAAPPRLLALLSNCALFKPNGGCRSPGGGGRHGKRLSLLSVVFLLGGFGCLGRWFFFSLSCFCWVLLGLLFFLLGPSKNVI